jgi:hypothetical protein
MMIRMVNAIRLATSRPRQHRIGAIDLADLNAPFCHDVKRVLHHQHGAVYHHTDANGQSRQRHQIGGKPHLIHENEGDQHRERQGGYHHQRRTQFAQEQEQYNNDQNRNFD